MSKINQLKYEMENLEKRKKQISEEIFLENQKNVFTNLIKGKYYSFKTDSWSKREYIIKYDPDKVYMENDTISGGIAIYFNLPMFVSYEDGQFDFYPDDEHRVYLYYSEVSVKEIDIKGFEDKIRKSINAF